MKKIKKMISVIVVVLSMLTFTQSAFADITPITSWTTTEYFGCEDGYSSYSVYESVDGISLNQASSTSCDLEITGTTYVSSGNQILIDYSYEEWDSGDGYITISMYRGDGTSEYFDFYDAPRTGDGTVALDVSGYTGPVEIKFTSYTYGNRHLWANFYIHQ
ncbi:hypothetical protein GCM10023310_70610 [Paenibacillus vulneris]|uniref:Uncharacterized protein n=1 Tax=Paenibacillus vulneris TaxID=1133364 RepID=A0ABW3UEZ9_9BACL